MKKLENITRTILNKIERYNSLSPREQQLLFRAKVKPIIEDVAIFLGICFMVFGALIGGTIDYETAKAEGKIVETKTETEIKENTMKTRTEINSDDLLFTNEVEGQAYVYIICDVVSNDFGTLNVEMPNGELHIYEIEDSPEGKIELVCFRVAECNQDDYSSYEVVAVR